MSGIIVGVDGSGHSRRALEWAVSEAATRQQPLTVLTVYRAVVGYLGEPVQYVGDAELTERALKEAQKETEDVLKEFAGSQKPSVTVRAVTGTPADELLAAAEGADMLVVGARGAGGFKRLLLGSVSTQVTHHAHCPVVVVRDKA